MMLQNNLTALAGVHISELDHLTPQQRVAVLAALTQRVTLIQGRLAINDLCTHNV